MIEFEISNELLRNAEERVYRMEETAKSMFDELFPNLDYEKDFLQNENFIDIQYMYEIVDTAVAERGYERYGVLHKLIDWTLDGLLADGIRERNFENIRNLDEKGIEEFLTWMQKHGVPYEDAQDPECQVEMISSFQHEQLLTKNSVRY